MNAAVSAAGGPAGAAASASPGPALALAALALLAGLAGVHQLVRASGRRSSVLALTGAAVPATRPARRPDLWLDDLVRRTPPGRRLARHLAESGVSLGVVHLLLLAVAAVLLIRTAVAALLLAPAGFSLFAGVVGGLAAVLAWVRSRRARHRERFTDQVADLAQVLANLTFAGMAVPYALAVAAQELPEPSAGEVRRLVRALSIGTSLDAALGQLAQRMPSRQLTVLAVTLSVTNRSGGDLVQALRGTATTLRSRQDARDEVRTVLAKSRGNALYLVLLVPVFILIIRVIDSQAFAKLLAEAWGVAVMVVVVALVAAGTVLIQRTSRIEV